MIDMDYESVGRRFESCWARHKDNNLGSSSEEPFALDGLQRKDSGRNQIGMVDERPLGIDHAGK